MGILNLGSNINCTINLFSIIISSGFIFGREINISKINISQNNNFRLKMTSLNQSQFTNKELDDWKMLYDELTTQIKEKMVQRDCYAYFYLGDPIVSNLNVEQALKFKADFGASFTPVTCMDAYRKLISGNPPKIDIHERFIYPADISLTGSAVTIRTYGVSNLRSVRNLLTKIINGKETTSGDTLAAGVNSYFQGVTSLNEIGELAGFFGSGMFISYANKYLSGDYNFEPITAEFVTTAGKRISMDDFVTSYPANYRQMRNEDKLFCYMCYWTALMFNESYLNKNIYTFWQSATINKSDGIDYLSSDSTLTPEWMRKYNFKKLILMLGRLFSEQYTYFADGKHSFIELFNGAELKSTGGNIRVPFYYVMSINWDDPKNVLAGEVLELTNQINELIKQRKQYEERLLAALTNLSELQNCAAITNVADLVFSENATNNVANVFSTCNFGTEGVQSGSNMVKDDETLTDAQKKNYTEQMQNLISGDGNADKQETPEEKIIEKTNNTSTIIAIVALILVVVLGIGFGVYFATRSKNKYSVPPPIVQGQIPEQ